MYPFGCDIPDQILGLRLRPKFLRDALRVYLRAAKNDCRIAAHSFARMPATTSTR